MTGSKTAHTRIYRASADGPHQAVKDQTEGSYVILPGRAGYYDVTVPRRVRDRVEFPLDQILGAVARRVYAAARREFR